MQQFDEEMNLLTREVQHLKRVSHINQPFLINAFNNHFDKSLKELVLQYCFDFDKIALHLYYQFPQYQQRINYKTVTFRWWQITMTQIIQKQKKTDQTQSKSQNQQNQNSQDKIQDNDKVQLFTDNLFPFFDKSIENASFSTISTENYSKAMQKSQILTEEESQRFILYKPKFIIDTEYQLERYEVQDGWMSAQEKGDNFSQLVIEKLLKKVVSNEFQYDEFGGFGAERQQNGQNNGQSRKIGGQKNQKKWWEHQEDSQSECQPQEQIVLNKQRDEKEQKAIPFFEDQNNKDKEKQEKELKQRNNKIKVYDIDEDWDEYESD